MTETIISKKLWVVQKILNFCMTSELFESDELHLLLLSNCTQTDDNENLNSLETARELTVCTEE